MEEKKQALEQPLPAWAYMAAFFALLIIVAGFLLLFNYLGQSISEDPTTNYFMLVLLGLAAAVATTGAMRAVANFSGGFKNNKIELGGPIVAAALVVVGGYYFLNRNIKPVENPNQNPTEIPQDNKTSNNTPPPKKVEPPKTITPFIDKNGIEVTFKSTDNHDAEIYINDEYLGCNTPCKRKLKSNEAYIVYAKTGKLKSAERPLRIMEDAVGMEVVLRDFKTVVF